MLAERLRERRNAIGETQDDLAALLEIKRQTYSAYERGVSLPDANALNVLADHFGCTVDYLLGRDDQDPPKDHGHPFSYAASLNIDPKEMTPELHKSLEAIAREMIEYAKAQKKLK